MDKGKMNIDKIVESQQTPRQIINNSIENWCTTYNKQLSQEQKKKLIKSFTSRITLSLQISGLNVFIYLSRTRGNEVDLRSYFKDPSTVSDILFSIGVVNSADFKTRITDPLGTDFFYMIGTPLK